jgi:membrane protease YdiL (CAAX protease family)
MSKGEIKSFRQADAWISIFGCFFILILGGTILQPLIRAAIPHIFDYILYHIFPILSLLLPTVYLSTKYGFVSYSELLLRGNDILVLCISLIILFLMAAFISLGGPYGPPLFGQIADQSTKVELYFTFVVIFIAGPFLEETLFRKYIFNIFTSKYNIVIAMTLTALLGTFLHLGFGNIRGLIFVFCLSFFFTMVYWKSNLGTSFLTHSLASLLIYITSWR